MREKLLPFAPLHDTKSSMLLDAETVKVPFHAAILGFSVTFAALHSQKTPRGIMTAKENEKLHFLAICGTIKKMQAG